MHWPRIIMVSVIVLLVLGGAAFPGVYYYRKYKEAEKKLERNPLLLEENSQALIDEIGQLIDLPKDEVPTVATVSDVEKLKNQQFFAKAKNGDKVLIYNTAKKAILYDPVGKKILEVGPLIATAPSPGAAQVAGAATAAPQLNVSEKPGQTTPTPAAKAAATTPSPTKAAQALRIVLANGTTISGLTSVVENQIKGNQSTAATVVDKRNAAKKDYAKTLVVDLTGTHKEETENMAQYLEADVSSLPAGEEKPANADLLIIVGTDKK